MSKKSVFCIATSRPQAEQIVDRLKNANFSNNDISVLFPDKQTNRDFAHEKNTKAPEGAITGAGTGGVLGGALGWLVGIGALAIPGVGPFIAAGPIMAALSGAAIGAAAGGVAGALIGMGVPELEAKRYEGKLKEGNILISVHAENSDQISRAKEIFKQANAQDICSTGEASTPDSSRVEKKEWSKASTVTTMTTARKTSDSGKNLEDLFFDELADMYDSEKRLVKALPKMKEAATCAHLQAAIEDHLRETEGHVTRIENVFRSFGREAKGKKCEATVGLLDEGDEIASDFKGSPAINAALISAAQKVEHYEIASYGCLHEWAEMLDHPEAAALLKQTLAEEKHADEKLTSLARSATNEEAREGVEPGKARNAAKMRVPVSSTNC
jgi:ferritin-like metal-binding protein YciE